MLHKYYTCTALKRKPPVINYYCIQIFAQQTTCLYTFGSFTLNSCNVYHTYCIYFHLKLTVAYDRFTFSREMKIYASSLLRVSLFNIRLFLPKDNVILCIISYYFIMNFVYFSINLLFIIKKILNVAL